MLEATGRRARLRGPRCRGTHPPIACRFKVGANPVTVLSSAGHSGEAR